MLLITVTQQSKTQRSHTRTLPPNEINHKVASTELDFVAILKNTAILDVQYQQGPKMVITTEVVSSLSRLGCNYNLFGLIRWNVWLKPICKRNHSNTQKREFNRHFCKTHPHLTLANGKEDETDNTNIHCGFDGTSEAGLWIYCVRMVHFCFLWKWRIEAIDWSIIQSQ